MKIDDNLPDYVLSALAVSLGFRPLYDRTPGVDEWTLSRGHGIHHRQFVGTRASVCAFLAGYGAMMLEASQMLNEIDNTQRQLINTMRARFDPDPTPFG